MKKAGEQNMASVFRKLICKELGENCYEQYFACYQKLISNKTYNHRVLNNVEIYEDIYDRLKDKDMETLMKMTKRLSESLHLVLRISRTFKFAIIAYVIGVVLLLFQGLPLLLGFGCIGLITTAFFYKTYEYVVNKYCFIDAHIVIIYKSVLDHLITYGSITNSGR